jgi:hypothetical protein
MSFSLQLEVEIRNMYQFIKNNHSNIPFNKRSHMAGLILAGVYDYYESIKDTNLTTDIDFFLSIKNPIKHILNILEKNSEEGGMSIKDSIREEIILINKERNINDKISLISVINYEMEIFENSSDYNNDENTDMLVSLIIENLNNHRVNGRLDSDTILVLKEPNLKLILFQIITSKKNGNDLSKLISDLYICIDNNNNNKLDKFKSEIENVVQKECNNIHCHIGHVGKTTFEAITINKEEKEIFESPKQIKISSRNRHSMAPNRRKSLIN